MAERGIRAVQTFHGPDKLMDSAFRVPHSAFQPEFRIYQDGNQTIKGVPGDRRGEDIHCWCTKGERYAGGDLDADPAA